MRYLCLVYHDEHELATLPAPEYDALVGATLAYRDGRRRGGHYLASEALHPADTATTIRIRGGSVSMADGHRAAMAAQAGGCDRTAARDLNEAIRVAPWIPSARWPGRADGEPRRQATTRAIPAPAFVRVRTASAARNEPTRSERQPIRWQPTQLHNDSI